MISEALVAQNAFDSAAAAAAAIPCQSFQMFTAFLEYFAFIFWFCYEFLVMN
jgi:hypothetical protein